MHVHLNTLHLRDEAHGSNNIYTLYERPKPVHDDEDVRKKKGRREKESIA